MNYLNKIAVASTNRRVPPLYGRPSVNDNEADLPKTALPPPATIGVNIRRQDGLQFRTRVLRWSGLAKYPVLGTNYGSANPDNATSGATSRSCSRKCTEFFAPAGAWESAMSSLLLISLMTINANGQRTWTASPVPCRSEGIPRPRSRPLHERNHHYGHRQRRCPHRNHSSGQARAMITTNMAIRTITADDWRQVAAVYEVGVATEMAIAFRTWRSTSTQTRKE